MSEQKDEVFAFTPQMIDLVNDLLSKSDVVFEKTNEHKNCDLSLNGISVPIRVDDFQLLYIGCRLLPNIMNYLVNIIPQFLYPYVVAYLQDLSSLRDDPLTINELYNYLVSN